MTTKFNPLNHHILVLTHKNGPVSFRDLMTYQKWIVAQSQEFLAELVAKYSAARVVEG